MQLSKQRVEVLPECLVDAERRCPAGEPPEKVQEEGCQ